MTEESVDKKDETIDSAATETSENNSSGAEQSHALPQPTFSTVILSLASSALVQLGEMPDPTTGKLDKNILAAKHSIDMLSMLQEKTKGNLDDDEIRLLEGILYELRMKYVAKK